MKSVAVGRVASSQLNAWSVFLAARELGVKVFSDDPDPVLPIPVVTAEIACSAEWVFFTDEDSLRNHLGDEKAHVKGLPYTFPLVLLDNKARMATWLLDHGEQPIPFDPDPHLGEFPKIIKSRHSSGRGRTPTPRLGVSIPG